MLNNTRAGKALLSTKKTRQLRAKVFGLNWTPSMRAKTTSSPFIPAAAGILFAFALSSCDKVWELGKELQAPEEPPAELVENSAPVSIPNAPGYTPPEETKPVEPPEPPKPKFNADAQVSILGYHDFTESGSGTDMKINIDKFRKQMQMLKDAEIPVISMRDYMEWKNGEKEIPSKCVVITMDDGWVGVYDLAYPIIKEFGYPFSIYLYKNYVNTGGRSLTFEQVREMMANGCEVGSHSVSHDFMARTRGRSAEQYETWLREELGESLRFLREHFGEDVLPVFVYPYGNYNDQVVELAEEYGYQVGLTVAPKKADHSLDNLRVGRYIIHGDNEINITAALRYRGGESLAGGQGLLGSNKGGGASKGGTEEKPEPLVTTSPEAGATVADRLPKIEVNISKLKGVSSDSITMRVSGLGRVPYQYDAANGIISYQMPERIRQPSCSVQVSLKRSGQSKHDIIAWDFKVDRTVLYIPPQPVKATPISEPEVEESAAAPSAAVEDAAEPSA